MKKMILRMLSMCPLAWYISKRTLQLCCMLLAGACAMLYKFNGDLTGAYELYMTAAALNETVQALLLIGVISAVTIEDVQS